MATIDFFQEFSLFWHISIIYSMYCSTVLIVKYNQQ